MKALYFGTYDRGHPRNVNAIAALRTAGVEVVERQAPIRGHGVRGAFSVFGAETRLLAPKGSDFDVVIVGYPGHFDVPRARRIARKKPLVFDAVLSLEDELIAVRRRFRDRSAAATVLRAVDYRALRLPNLVVCGTDAEARYLEELGAKKTASVFLGADEDVFCETWSPTYPFSAVHFADDPVVGQTDASIPIEVSEADDRSLAVAHAGIVLGSFRESRAIPAIVFEACATGAPVVTGDTDAARELLTDGDSALLVPVESPGALGEAIDRLAQDEGLRARIAERGREVFRERASREVLGARWRALLAETL
ncbi:MAG TPA: glycosyltransferase [Gaiellaceae bacterium]|nr:glycosyltransferase [Gaiellaceae bacterium]